LKGIVQGVANQSALLNQKLNELVASLENQSRLFSTKLEETILGVSNQSSLLNQRLSEIAAILEYQSRLLTTKLDETILGVGNQSSLLNQRLSEIVAGLSAQSGLLNQRLSEIAAGVSNQSHLFNVKLEESIHGVSNQSLLLNQRLNEIIVGLSNQTCVLNDKLNAVIGTQQALQGIKTNDVGRLATEVSEPYLADHASETAICPEEISPFRSAMQRMPLLLAEKTYNTSHPRYDSTLVRNYPGHIFNYDKPCKNIVFNQLKVLTEGSEVPSHAWDNMLRETLEEVRSTPHANQVFERRTFIERYTADLQQKYQAYYSPGWVNLDDALFLYWLVRRLAPRTIVQTGVCNGLSSAFMILALSNNGPDGRLHAIDLPPIFDSNDPAWTIRDNVYRAVIPEGKSPGWMIPDAYRDRLAVWNGDAKSLLSKLVNTMTSIDLFYHDSDHAYSHMMFEFREAKRKLVSGGLIVADDVSWNASLWDFADQHAAPSYNYKGAVGVAFF